MNIKEVSSIQLAGLLSSNFDFVLELGVLQEQELCIKPVYKFERAFVADENIPEFCLIYSEADDPEEIFVSVNSKKFEKILSEYKNYKMIYHGENGGGEFYESFYFDKTVEADSISARIKGENGFRPYTEFGVLEHIYIYIYKDNKFRRINK